MRTGNEQHILAFLHWLKTRGVVIQIPQHELISWMEMVVKNPGGQVAPEWVREFEAFEAAPKAGPRAIGRASDAD